MRLPVGTTARSMSDERRYAAHRRSQPATDACTFCQLQTEPDGQVLAESEHCLVISNLFPYSVWDTCGVSEHMMVIPKRHVASLAELDDAERLDYVNLVSKYEADGYSLYARSPGNATKTITHQHMHLMQIDNRRKKWLFFLRKPHILWTR